MIKTNPDHPLTSEYFIGCKDKSLHAPLLVFIPGNPGLIDYYTTYLQLIHERFPHYDVVAISHAGFQTSGEFVREGSTNDQRFYDLDYQIHHKCEILKKYILSGNTNLSFLSHSVGGYIVQRVIQGLLQDEEVNHMIKIEFSGLICPTIVDIAKSDSGVFFSKLFRYLPVVSLAVAVISLLQLLLPDSWARYIIKSCVISRPVSSDERLKESWNNSVDATFKIFKSKRIVRQALTLAQQELQVIHRDDEMNDWYFLQLPKMHGVRHWCFFAANDYWVHDNSRDYILSRYHSDKDNGVFFQIGNTSNENCRSITHSFCIDQSVEFAQITCEALEGVVATVE